MLIRLLERKSREFARNDVLELGKLGFVVGNEGGNRLGHCFDVGGQFVVEARK